MFFTQNIISGGAFAVTIVCLTIFFHMIVLFLMQNYGGGQCRALILYVAAGAFQEALAALREAKLPDTAAMFVVACNEIHAEIISGLVDSEGESESSTQAKHLNLPGLEPENEDVVAVEEFYGHYQRKLVHLCMDSQPSFD